MTCLADQVDDHLLVDPQVVAISALEAGLEEARTWGRIIGTDRILSGTVLVNALCLLDGLDLVEEEAGITITGVLVRPRDAEGHRRHEVVVVVVAVDAAAVNEAVETGSHIVLYPVLLRKPGIDTGFDALALYRILFCFTACMHLWPVCKLLLAITIFVSFHNHGPAAMGTPWKKKILYKMRSEIHIQSRLKSSFPITGRRLITTAMTDKSVLKDTNQII